MLTASALRLLPLAGLVAFPGTEILLSVGASAGVNDGDTVGLVHRRCDGRLESVGTLATATVRDADVDGSRVISCAATSRFRIVELLDRGNEGAPMPLTARRFEPHEDELADDAEAHELCDSVRRRVRELVELNARVEGGVASGAEAPPPSESMSAKAPAAFSLALAGAVEHESLADAQALLESTDTTERLRALDAALEDAARFTSTQALLQQLSLG